MDDTIAAPPAPAAPATPATPDIVAAPPEARRVLALSCLAHALHDGYTDMIYVLLPLWQADFGLGFGALALLRGVYAGTMATLQLPAGRVAGRLGTRKTLALGTLLAAAGYALAGVSGGMAGLVAALAVSGTGSSTQHPLASVAVSRVYGRAARAPLSVYNFSGDLGKAIWPAALSLMVVLMPWRHALGAMAVSGCLVALVIGLLFPALPRATASAPAPSAASIRHARTALLPGFKWLFAIGVLDTAVRMGLLTFLPFLLKAKGASTPLIGTALALVFIGGAAGKFACGWLGARLGVVGTVLATEGGTAALIIAVMLAPLAPTLVMLPLLGVMLNGTSSVLYGTVPELAPPEATERAFALFYTGTIGAGAVAPVVFGVLGDAIGMHGATAATALTALAICPIVLALRSHLDGGRAADRP